MAMMAPAVAPNAAASAGAELLERLAGAMLVLVVPHPDDESLALAGLIQHALHRRARVVLLQVTDGDNNPWPQRCLERRLRIGPAARERWGRRRDGEMLRAMYCLGLDEDARRCLHWPDLGVTARLHAQPTPSIDAFACLLRALAPDIVVTPTLRDRHPDHAACHVLVRLALRHASLHPLCLGYHVHGRMPEREHALTLPLDAAMRRRKRHAILAHASQVALARRRLLAQVRPVETLFTLPGVGCADTDPALPDAPALPWRAPLPMRRWLRVGLVHPDGACTWRWHEAPLRLTPDAIRLVLPATVRRAPAFARLDLPNPSPWIFEHWGWCDLTADRSRAKL